MVGTTKITMQGKISYTNNQLLAVFRANTKNAIVLEEHLREKGAQNLKAQGLQVPARDPSDPEEFDRQENSPPPAYATSPPSISGTQGHGSKHSSPTSHQAHNQRTSPTSPHAQTQIQAAPEESRGGWFGFGKKKKQPDVERTGDLRRDEQQTTDSSASTRNPKLQKNSR